MVEGWAPRATEAGAGRRAQALRPPARTDAAGRPVWSRLPDGTERRARYRGRGALDVAEVLDLGDGRRLGHALHAQCFVNLASATNFKNLPEEEATMNDAAWGTWTGQRLRSRGFTRVKVAIGSPDWVRARFER